MTMLTDSGGLWIPWMLLVVGFVFVTVWKQVRRFRRRRRALRGQPVDARYPDNYVGLILSQLDHDPDDRNTTEGGGGDLAERSHARKEGRSGRTE